MAYISSTGSSGQTTTSTSFEATLPSQVDSGDYLLAFISIRPGTTGTMTAPAGWSQLNAGSSTPTVRLLVWRKVAGAGETNPTFAWSGAAASWSIVIHAIKDYDATTPIHNTVHINNAASSSINIPAISTTNADCILVYGVSSNTATPLPNTNDIYWRSLGGTTAVGTTAFTGSFQQDTAGTKAAFSVPNISSQVSQSTVVAINNSAGGSKDLNKNSNVTRIRDMGNYDSGGFLTFVAPNAGVTGLTSIAGVPLASTSSTVSASVVASGTMYFYQYQWTFNVSTAGADTWFGAWNTLSSVTNLQDKVVSQSFSIGGTQHSPVYGSIIVFADTSDNWVAYELMARKNYVFNNQQVKHIAIGVSTAYASGGAIDWTQVNRVGWFSARRSTGTSTQNLNVSRLLVNDGITLTHGGASNPINYPRLQEAIFNASVGAGHSNLQGAGQFFNRSSINIGDGVNKTFANLSGQSYEFPTASDATWAGSTAINEFQIKLKTSVNDVIDFSSSLFSSSVQQRLIIDPTGVLPSTPANFEGTVFIGWDVENNLSGWEFKNTTFKNSKILTNGGLLDGCSLTGSAGVTTVTTNNPENLSNCSFKSGGTGHAIEMTVAGSYDFTGNTFAGYGADGSTDAAIYNTSGGLVTLLIPAGGQTPTVRNSAGSTTVIDIPIQNQEVVLTGGVANSRVQIFDVTSNTELVNQVVTSFPFSWQDPNPYVADRQIRLRVAYQNGATAKMFIDQIIGTATNASPVVSYFISQEGDEVYNTNAIDGSTITTITINDAFLLVSVNTGTVNWASIYAYETYWLYTEVGIRDEGRFIEAIDPANYRLYDFKIKNITSPSIPLILTGGWGRDAVTNQTIDIIDTSGGTVFSNPDIVISYATGSAVTPADKTDIINGVRAEMDSNSTKLIGIKKNTDLIPGAL